MSPRAACADEIADQVAQLKDLVKDGDESRIVTAIAAFEKKRDKRVDDALLVVARTPKLDRAAKEAMRVLGLHGDQGFLGWAKSRLDDKKMLEDHPDLYYAMLDSMPAAGVALKPHLRGLADCVDDTLMSKSDVARRAITAYASAGSEKPVIDQLIEWLEKTEADVGGGGGGARGGLTTPPPSYNGGGGGGGGGSNPAAVKEALIASLEKLTGGSGSDSGSWKAWWAEHKATFKPSAPQAPEPVWATLKEFADDEFEFVLGKPVPDANWTFEKCDLPGGRVRLRFQDATGLHARLDVTAFKKGKYATAEVFGKHLDEDWRKTDFSDFFKGGEPAIASKQIGGRDFSVVTARGVGAGSWKDWDGFERRVYVTAADAGTLLVFEAAVRAGFSEAQKAALWKDVESVTFAAAK